MNHSKDLTLVILAAGMGSRYGGLKQLDPVGPHDATIMDYSVYDAKRAWLRASRLCDQAGHRAGIQRSDWGPV